MRDETSVAATGVNFVAEREMIPGGRYWVEVEAPGVAVTFHGTFVRFEDGRLIFAQKPKADAGEEIDVMASDKVSVTLVGMDYDF